MTVSNRFLFIFSFLVLTFIASPAAYADCSDPAGKAGTMDYFTSDGVYKFCDGTDWHSMKGGAASGEDVASKDYVDAAVAAGGSGYTPPTQFMFTSTIGRGNTANDNCDNETADGGGWRIGSSRDLYFFHLNGVFPAPASAHVWMTVIPQPEIPLATGTTSQVYSTIYAGSNGFVSMAGGNNYTKNCFGWTSATNGVYGGILRSDQVSVNSESCNSSLPSFCVK
ncbi:hypothetical protein [Thalassobaculum litoreum]|uniref:DUF1554 domain-containing protein n=1 Tax=Thalassobaculum litoreum DSM 18839 TaxID=1123362 RepID=A0A8G2BGQ9_9PROT|nr:hypothetical protein [Thalassobaculum litoreum]SDF61621.1 hypothetical protein SAMN05660686_01776 [Thalassobaculum litoreum DSM 18839]